MSQARLAGAINTATYLLSEHPSIVNFRWSSSLSFASTWSFLFTALALYIAAATTLHLILSLLLPKRRAVPLGPIPALHSLSISVVSATIFVGILFSAAAEIRETRWFWRRTKTVTNPLQWLLCFPLGTRPSGRVFFWSYIFYLSRFLHLFRTFFTILRKRKLIFFQVLNQSFLLCISFLWLEFSQSFQVLAIMLSTLLYAVVYGYRFWTAIGLPAAGGVPFVVNCQVVMLVCNLVCHFGVLLLHFRRGGCNGIGAWLFNSVLNGVLLLLVLDFYVKMHLSRKRRSVAGGEDSGERLSGSSNSTAKKN